MCNVNIYLLGRVKWPLPVQIADNRGKPIKDVTESHQVLPQRLLFGVEENGLLKLSYNFSQR